MSLTVGARLGSYEVVGTLGAGGHGRGLPRRCVQPEGGLNVLVNMDPVLAKRK